MDRTEEETTNTDIIIHRVPKPVNPTILPSVSFRVTFPNYDSSAQQTVYHLASSTDDQYVYLSPDIVQICKMTTLKDVNSSTKTGLYYTTLDLLPYSSFASQWPDGTYNVQIMCTAGSYPYYTDIYIYAAVDTLYFTKSGDTYNPTSYRFYCTQSSAVLYLVGISHAL